MMLMQARLLEILHYDPLTGLWTHLRGKNIGLRAGAKSDERGYEVIMIDGKRYYLHRLAVLYMTGAHPKEQVDHINLDKGDGRWLNLREASRSQNYANRLKYKNNVSGFRGVYKHTQYDKWVANIRHNRKNIHLGVFDDPVVAHEAYLKAAQRIYGEFARGG